MDLKLIFEFKCSEGSTSTLDISGTIQEFPQKVPRFSPCGTFCANTTESFAVLCRASWILPHICHIFSAECNFYQI